MRDLLQSLNINEKILIYPKLYINTNTDLIIAKKVSYKIEYNLKGIFHLVTEDVVNYKDFYNELIIGLGFNNARLVDNFEEEGYFALLSKRGNEFPNELKLTNQSVINYLIN